MHYEVMAQDALRGVVRAALQRAASPQGLPGAHHFYITIKTDAAGVSIPQDLREKYPDEITIVLQHQFWDLSPDGDIFSITLSFGGQPKKIVAPYAAVTRFYDPSVQFLLQFEAPPSADPPDKEDIPEIAADRDDDEPKIVSLDQFRKK